MKDGCGGRWWGDGEAFIGGGVIVKGLVCVAVKPINWGHYTDISIHLRLRKILWCEEETK